jgi:hypothetical protein
MADLARALRLTPDRLAGHTPSAEGAVGRYSEPGLMFLLDSLTTMPAHVVDDLTTWSRRTS